MFFFFFIVSIQFHVLVRDLTGRAYPLEGTTPSHVVRRRCVVVTYCNNIMCRVQVIGPSRG